MSYAETHKPFWVVLEGEDGVGKTTTIHRLRWSLSYFCRPVIEAYGKAENYDNWKSYVSEMLTRLPVLRRLLDDGYDILQDRSVLSTVVYQGAEKALEVWDRETAVDNLLPDVVYILPPYGRYSDWTKDIVLPYSQRVLKVCAVPTLKTKTYSAYILEHLAELGLI